MALIKQRILLNQCVGVSWFITYGLLLMAYTLFFVGINNTSKYHKYRLLNSLQKKEIQKIILNIITTRYEILLSKIKIIFIYIITFREFLVINVVCYYCFHSDISASILIFLYWLNCTILNGFQMFVFIVLCKGSIK